MLRRIPPRPASAFLLFYGNKKHSQNATGKKLKFQAFISTVLADFISLLAGAIQQKPVIPAFPASDLYCYCF
jgi:hypothetical protein